jgi:hypothetical protein
MRVFRLGDSIPQGSVWGSSPENCFTSHDRSWRQSPSPTECRVTLPAFWALLHTHRVGPGLQEGREGLEGRRLRPTLCSQWHTCPVQQHCWGAVQSAKRRGDLSQKASVPRRGRCSAFLMSADAAKPFHTFFLNHSYLDLKGILLQSLGASKANDLPEPPQLVSRWNCMTPGCLDMVRTHCYDNLWNLPISYFQLVN